MLYFSSLTGGFYDSTVHGNAIPDDVVEITVDKHAALLAGQSTGQRIISDAKGYPILEPVPVFTLSDTKTALCERIDTHAASIYSRWTRFEAEYRAREAAAKAFKDAGYQGEPGLYVTSFAEPAGLTPRAAADAILAQAAALRAAQDALAALRMRKYEVARAANAETAQTVANEIVAAMDEIMRRIG